MIPTEFDYHRATSLDDALAKLAGGGAKLLAGGHSLIPLMKLRLSEPGSLIDIARIPELSGIRKKGDKLSAAGDVTFVRADSDADAVRLLDVFFRQKIARMRQIGQNDVFGDPIFGTVKGCAIRIPPASTEWTFCAEEGGVCEFAGTAEVRYGANGSFMFKTLTDGTACTNEVFGDPIVGTVKQCSIK